VGLKRFNQLVIDLEGQRHLTSCGTCSMGPPGARGLSPHAAEGLSLLSAVKPT